MSKPPLIRLQVTSISLGGAGFGGAGGQGGQSYVISKATHIQDNPGNGGAGGYASNGGNGYVDISFYS